MELSTLILFLPLIVGGVMLSVMDVYPFGGPNDNSNRDSNRNSNSTQPNMVGLNSPPRGPRPPRTIRIEPSVSRPADPPPSANRRPQSPGPTQLSNSHLNLNFNERSRNIELELDNIKGE